MIVMTGKSSKSSTKSKNPLVVLLFLISFSIYTLYCIYHQGSFVRGIGWKSRAEYPLSYNITLAFAIIFPVGTIVNHIFWHIKKNRTEYS
tara:strand:+ start:8958 stop:9227 length:270 start_codon:yes stop_codon:yes gene_type:complete